MFATPADAVRTGLGLTLLTGALGLAISAAPGATGPATAADDAARAARAPVTVTIDSEGTDMFGTLGSTRPVRCAAEREVRVYKLVDGVPHLFASDTTGDEPNADGTYDWSTGNTGTEGRFFAKVKAKPGCRGDVSPTIRVRRNP
ncbi:hypothetical protein [Nocardioides sp. GXZ039]|uniref:hypothetical protein n=1 Tax=Nocardioides sp. GXZ039 TaxID=3136018 RepID=UPI0030F3BBF1